MSMRAHYESWCPATVNAAKPVEDVYRQVISHPKLALRQLRIAVLGSKQDFKRSQGPQLSTCNGLAATLVPYYGIVEGRASARPRT